MAYIHAATAIQNQTSDCVPTVFSDAGIHGPMVA